MLTKKIQSIDLKTITYLFLPSLFIGGVILFFNFNPHEFDLFGKGEIVQPTKECQCFYLGKCKLGTSCMEDISTQMVIDAVGRTLK